MASSLPTCSSYSSFSSCFLFAVDLLFVDLLLQARHLSPQDTLVMANMAFVQQCLALKNLRAEGNQLLPTVLGAVKSLEQAHRWGGRRGEGKGEGRGVEGRGGEGCGGEGRGGEGRGGEGRGGEGRGGEGRGGEGRGGEGRGGEGRGGEGREGRRGAEILVTNIAAMAY